jgi:cytohesin
LPSPTQDDEEIIRSYQRLAEQGASGAKLEQFVAEHPALLRATAKPYGGTLMWVLEFEHQEAALVLIRAGAPVAPPKPNEGGPLHVAARGGLDAVVTELLARGAPATAADYWGTPLHFAARQGHASTMRLLIQAGADPSAHASDHDFTPLHGAVIGRHVEAVRVLISAKADLEAKDDDGRTPLHWGGFAYAPQPVHRYARLGGPHTTSFVDPGPAKAMAVLLDAGARVDAVDAKGNTPLHAAVQVGSRRGVELLLARGARRSVKNHAGETPLSLAKARNDADIVRMLGGRP